LNHFLKNKSKKFKNFSPQKIKSPLFKNPPGFLKFPKLPPPPPKERK